MFFFVKKSTIEMDAFTHWEHVYKYSPIIEARQKVPDWFTSMEGKYMILDDLVPQATIKMCPAIQDYVLRGVIMPLWSDLAIAIEERIVRWQFADMLTENESHPERQWAPFRSPYDYAHMKLRSPWILSCKEEVLFSWEKPFFHNDLPKEIEIVSGIDEYKYQNSSNVNFFVDVRQDNKLTIPQGTPLVRLLPLSDKKVRIKNHLVDEAEWKKKALKNQPVKFINQYRKMAKKCPFHSE